MKKVIFAAVLFLFSAGVSAAATLDSVSYPGGDTVETASIIQYAHPENALECSVTKLTPQASWGEWPYDLQALPWK